MTDLNIILYYSMTSPFNSYLTSFSYSGFFIFISAMFFFLFCNFLLRSNTPIFLLFRVSLVLSFDLYGVNGSSLFVG
jgi:hypothetical protein